MDRFQILKAAVALAAVMSASPLFAQDQIILTTPGAPPVSGKIERVLSGQVVINVGVGSRQVPLAQVKSVTMTPPPEFNQAVAAYEAGEIDKSLQLLRKAVDSFKGLPAEWVERGMGMIIDLYVDKQQVPRAQQEFAEFEKLYPTAKGDRITVMKAKMAVANKKAGEAKAALEPIAKAALEKKEVTAQEGAMYGQVFLVMGQVYESENKLPEALESYLRTVTVFYQDPTASAAAQSKANTLRSANKTLVAP